MLFFVYLKFKETLPFADYIHTLVCLNNNLKHGLFQFAIYTKKSANFVVEWVNIEFHDKVIH